MKQIQQAAELILKELERVIHGKRPALRLALVCLLSEGHLLIEDVPGTGKTLLCKALARALGGTFRRVQGTPDLLPGDITGSSVWNPKDAAFTFHPGPIFANLVLVDEINRATPRAQAALLECMAERQASIDGQTYRMPQPFLVVATQNPVEYEGTFPLPEAQLDRFLMRLSLGYPSLQDEEQMLLRSEKDEPLEQVQRILRIEQLALVQRHLREVFVHSAVRAYIIRLVAATRGRPEILLGAGPRATKGLFRAAQALAAISGRDYVLPDDVKALFPAIVQHRVVLSAESRLNGRTPQQALEEAIRSIAAPVDVGPRAGAAATSPDEEP